MKTLFTFYLLLLLALPDLSAQQFIKMPDFGKVEKADLELKECSFEKNASAMVLFDVGESFFQINMQSLMSPVFQQTEHHVRIKIFNSKGFDRANVKIRYPSNSTDITIKSFSAQTYNLDASGKIVVTKVDKSSIYNKVINTRYSEKIFVFPDVKEGSVIEYKYILDGASEDVWYFQKSIPVKFSRFIVNFPSELEIAITPYHDLPVKKGIDKSASNNYTWYQMENIPGLIEEPFMSSPEDYLQRMDVRITALNFPGLPYRSLSPTWPGIIRSLMDDEDFGRQLKKSIPRTTDLDLLLLPLKDPFLKMQAIHQYVRNNMIWNNYDNIWALEGVKAAWKSKKGTSGEINLILINLLKDADLNVSPILVSTRENGIINTGVPGYEQFNKVMAFVDIGGQAYVLDATEQNTPSHLLPLEVMASEGLLIEKIESYKWGWRVLWEEKRKLDKFVSIYGEIDAKGLMKGNATIVSKDYAKLKLLPLIKAGNTGQIEALAGPGINIEDFKVTNPNDAAPIEQQFGFSMPTFSTNDYHYISTNLFTGLEKNIFLADDRTSDIFFGVNQNYTFNCNISLPDGYTLEALPKNMKMIMPDTSIVFSRQASFSEGLLSMTTRLEFKSPIYSKDSYPYFKEFYKKLLELLNEKLVYRKS